MTHKPTVSSNGQPHIESVEPRFALPGGEVRLTGSHLRPAELRQPRVAFADTAGSIVISSDNFLVARVPEGAVSGGITVTINGASSNPQQVGVAVPVAENLHPVANPAVDSNGVYERFCRANDMLDALDAVCALLSLPSDTSTSALRLFRPCCARGAASARTSYKAVLPPAIM